LKKAKFIVLSLIILLTIPVSIVVAYEMLTPISFGPSHLWPYVTKTTFVDGGNSNDTIKLTVLNTLAHNLSIQECIVNNQFVKFSGDLTLPSESTGDITLTLASGALVGGEQYDIWMNPNATNGVHMIWTNQRYIYYHMYHPDANGPVEEAVMTELFPGYYSRYFSYDEMGATIQNTGDFPITIIGGFVNGMAAINTTGHLTIDKNETVQVNMLFPPRSLLDQMLNGKPFQVKLVTTSNNLISYIEPYYYPDHNIINSEKPTLVIEKGEITGVRFNDNSLNEDTVTITFRNIGNTPVTITSGLFNGKAVEILQNSTTVDIGGTQELTLETGMLLHGSKYQIALISSENNVFISSSIMP
jgi:hypothetical protein